MSKQEVRSILSRADCRDWAYFAYQAASSEGYDCFLYMPDGGHVEAVVEYKGKIYDVEFSDVDVEGSLLILKHKLSKTQASSGWKETVFDSGSAFYPGFSFLGSILSRSDNWTIDEYGISTAKQELEALGYSVDCRM